ncbi:NAD(P)H-dependent oxidoreductase [Amycolatopsis azurea]|uniref:NAD(P)H oxidoreductase YRKL n=1 Tax=Amycolatopsis azurea DSM 43854 TaxID=1238180 RepID=M2QP29_9PSEU|nr:NAD(P)H-dependent oxidoreductase [Amycolatopsis azurea]EMD27572.1 NAD(P)H oxidoreductase YRKL [Amycolatopsis azurea DSM 43854]OOC06350.1 NADPH:quinone reductase [Amycolatopsis azurea DSM 43854]
MNVLWIFAHPESRSFGGSLRDEGVRALREQGAEVRESDLYAMKWNPVVDADDFGSAAGSDRLFVGPTSKTALLTGELSADIRAEHEKLAWADTVIVQFPLWWYGMPAILKGWFDRVFVKGFAYGVQRPDGRTARYGEGALAGKRAMVVLTTGTSQAAIGPRGINGEVSEILFPLQHGALWYTGMSVLPPLTICGADRASAEQYDVAAEALRERLRTLSTQDPIPFRHQNGGDYDDNLVLRDDLAPGRRGMGVHLDV